MRPALYYHAACTLKGTLAADDDEVIAEALQAVAVSYTHLTLPTICSV